MTSRIVAAVAILGLALAPVSAADRAGGSICIAPVTDRMRESDPTDPRGKPTPVKLDFTVQIDSGERIVVPSKKALALHGLDAKRQHLVRVRDGGKITQSFYFTFENRRSTVLCLSYGPWYESWDLSPPGRRPWCKCT